MALKFYTSVAKWSKIKVRKFLGLMPTLVEVTWEKLVGALFASPDPEKGYYKFTIQTLYMYTSGSILEKQLN